MPSDAPLSNLSGGRNSAKVRKKRGLTPSGRADGRSAVVVLLACTFAMGLAVVILHAHGHEEVSYNSSSLLVYVGKLGNDRTTLEESTHAGKRRYRANHKIERLKITGTEKLEGDDCKKTPPSSFEVVRIYAASKESPESFDIANVKRGWWPFEAHKLEFELPPRWKINRETEPPVETKKYGVPEKELFGRINDSDARDVSITKIEVYGSGSVPMWVCGIPKGRKDHVIVRIFKHEDRRKDAVAG
jgi:hypothetical protein